MISYKNAILRLTTVLTFLFLSCTQSQKQSPYFNTHPTINYQNLKSGFNNIPQEAKMRAWWFWMNGMATKESITQDLEAMKANGIAGAILCYNGGGYAPIGPTFMSDEWKDNFAHVISEADRLGIEISLNIQSGCGDPGNPNIEEDNGMKKITWSEQQVTGPKKMERS